MMLREKGSTDCYDYHDQILLPVYMKKKIWSYWCLRLRLEQRKSIHLPDQIELLLLFHIGAFSTSLFIPTFYTLAATLTVTYMPRLRLLTSAGAVMMESHLWS